MPPPAAADRPRAGRSWSSTEHPARAKPWRARRPPLLRSPAEVRRSPRRRRAPPAPAPSIPHGRRPIFQFRRWRRGRLSASRGPIRAIRPASLSRAGRETQRSSEQPEDQPLDKEKQQDQDHRRDVDAAEIGEQIANGPERGLREAMQHLADVAHDLVIGIDHVEGDEPRKNGRRDQDPDIERDDGVNEPEKWVEHATLRGPIEARSIAVRGARGKPPLLDTYSGRGLHDPVWTGP